MDFAPGQFLSFQLPKDVIPGAEFDYVRNYSISCRPGMDTFRISVKKEATPDHPDGVVSNYFHDTLEEGSEVMVRHTSYPSIKSN